MQDKSFRVAIVVDSAASLPPELSEGPQLHVVPMRLTIDGTTYLDGRDLTTAEFYRLLRRSSRTPSTSAPSPSSFLEAYHEAAQSADSVLCLTVASRFSSSAQAARAAMQEARTTLPNFEVRVVDTGNAAGGQALITLEAWRAAKQGLSLDEVAGVTEDVMPRVRLLAFLDTLYYLWKGGRVPAIAHLGASILRMKPLFELTTGDVRTVARPRTHARAMRRLLELVKERAGDGPLHVTVMHADAAEAAEELRVRMEADFRCDEIFVSEFTPVMGAHIGPGLLGVAFWGRPRRSG